MPVPVPVPVGAKNDVALLQGCAVSQLAWKVHQTDSGSTVLTPRVCTDVGGPMIPRNLN